MKPKPKTINFFPAFRRPTFLAYSRLILDLCRFVCKFAICKRVTNTDNYGNYISHIIYTAYCHTLLRNSVRKYSVGMYCILLDQLLCKAVESMHP